MYQITNVTTGEVIAEFSCLDHADKWLDMIENEQLPSKPQLKDGYVLLDGNVILRRLKPIIMLEDLDLSVRSYNVLERLGLRTLDDLSNLTIGEVTRLRNCGRRSSKEIFEKVTDAIFNHKLV